MAELVRGCSGSSDPMKSVLPGARLGGARIVVLIPYLWLVFLFLLPFLIVVKIRLLSAAIAQPPYTPVLDLGRGWQGLKPFAAALSLDNYSLIASVSLYLVSCVRSR